MTRVAKPSKEAIEDGIGFGGLLETWRLIESPIIVSDNITFWRRGGNGFNASYQQNIRDERVKVRT